MIPAFTRWAWLNCLILAFLLALGWAAGLWVWALLLGVLARVG